MFPPPTCARIALGLILICTLPSLALAQTSPGQPLGVVYPSALPTQFDNWITADPFTPFTMYLVLELDYADIGRGELNSGVGVQGWEAGVDVPGLGSDFIITSAIIRNESLNIGSNTNIIAGVSPPILASATPIDLLEYTILMPRAEPVQDVIVSLGPASPSSFDPAAPGFNESQDIGECEIIATGETRKCLRPFDRVRRAIINPTGHPIEPERWSQVKARY